MELQIDYSFLVLKRDKKRVQHINELCEIHPYFKIVYAVDAIKDWSQVENILVENNIKITGPIVLKGKLGRWASFIRWLVWMKKQHPQYNYAVLAEDDIMLVTDFKIKLENYIYNNPDKWFFRCGPYNSCLVIRCDMAEFILNRIRETGIDMPDDWWSWKSGKVLQPRGPKLVSQLSKFTSNIKRSGVINHRDRNPRIWCVK